MPPAYATALANAKAGDIVGPFKTDAGWVLLKVEDRRPEQPISLDAARPQIVNFLTDEQVGGLLKSLRGKSDIHLMIPPANPNGPGAMREPASAPPSALEAPAAAPPLSATTPSGQGTSSAPSAEQPAPITLAPPPPSSVILHMAPGAAPALPHLRSPPPASGPAGSHPLASPPQQKAPAPPTKPVPPPAKPPVAPRTPVARPTKSSAPPLKARPTKPAAASKPVPVKPALARAKSSSPPAKAPSPNAHTKPKGSTSPVRPHAVLEEEPMPYARYHAGAPPPAPRPKAAPSTSGPVVTAPPETSQ
jgi:hypothetical protein